MFTQCPYCQTIFRVSAAHLNIAQGHVRCSHCRNVFNATHQLIKELPQQIPVESFRIDDEHTIDFREAHIPELVPEDIYALPPRRQSWKAFLLLSITVIVLTTSLAGQMMWFFQRDWVLQHPEIRVWLKKFCNTFLCTLPPTRDVKSFEMQHHIAQIHSRIDDAIQFEATFINTATFPQPYPDIQLTFEDHNAQPLAQRRFKPAEYLQHPLRKNQQMQPNSPIYIKLELVDVASIIEGDKIAEGYRFEFF